MSEAVRTPEISEEKRRRLSTFLWFVGLGDSLRGPFTHEQLLRSLDIHEFEPGDYCWRQGFQEWRAICTVEEFEFEQKPYIVKSYPKVPVPSAKTKSMTAPPLPSSEYAKELLRKTSSNYFDQIVEPRTVKVRLERRNRFEMGLWERTGMILFGILMAWVSSWVALSEVEERFLERFEKWSTGRGVSLGTDPAYSGQNQGTLQQLAPILSAPGLSQLEDFDWKLSFEMQKPVSGPGPSIEAEGLWTAPSSHALEWNSSFTGEFRFQYDADPIFVETYRVYGIWTLKNPTSLRVRTLGHPGL